MMMACIRVDWSRSVQILQEEATPTIKLKDLLPHICVHDKKTCGFQTLAKMAHHLKLHSAIDSISSF
jgi:hypothetical protein